MTWPLSCAQLTKDFSVIIFQRSLISKCRLLSKELTNMPEGKHAGMFAGKVHRNEAAC